MSAPEQNDRRRFLARAGKVALATPPALTLLLATEGRHYAMAASGMRPCDTGHHDPRPHHGDYCDHDRGRHDHFSWFGRDRHHYNGDRFAEGPGRGIF